jgi:hypothetical protein
MEIYDGEDPRYARYRRAWEHVRSYGGG